MRPIIQVRNLSKQYRIGEKKAAYGTLRDSIAAALRNPFRRNNSEENTIWALRDVSFDIMPGEVVGIIGRNGAGKSTLLKVLSRITEPTSGEIDIYGRVGSLLEVGSGFHPELTGRENIFLNGSILGMKRGEIIKKFDEIVAFAEISKFLDTPVKHYSSGMYMKLAFSVAAHLDPEILFIDEVLAVGDYAFQEKCLKKANSIAKEGKTVLLVSHNLSAINEISHSSIWLNNGILEQIGQTQDIVKNYISNMNNRMGQWNLNQPTNESAFIARARIIQNGVNPTPELMIDQPFEIELKYIITRKMKFCRVGLIISNSFGVTLFSTAEPDDPFITPYDRLPGTYVSRCMIPGWLLAANNYFITFHIDDEPLKRLFTADNACSFVVVDNVSRGPSHYYRPGVIAPKLRWQLSESSDTNHTAE